MRRAAAAKPDVVRSLHAVQRMLPGAVASGAGAGTSGSSHRGTGLCCGFGSRALCAVLHAVAVVLRLGIGALQAAEGGCVGTEHVVAG